MTRDELHLLFARHNCRGFWREDYSTLPLLTLIRVLKARNVIHPKIISTLEDLVKEESEGPDPLRFEKAGKRIKETLRQNAIEATQYVAFGKVLKKELTTEFGLTEAQATAQLEAIAKDMIDGIRKL